MFNHESSEAASQPTTNERTVSPLDLRQTTFPTAWKGYDQARVRAFLLAASESFEAAARENERLRQEITRLDSVIRQHRELEATLNNTLVQAQKVSDDMRNHAQLEADRLVREAKGRAELLMAAAQNRLDDVQREIDGLKMKRREVEVGIESIIGALTHTLEFVREQPRDTRVASHQPRIQAVS
jgi:cell division initiation protein